jgi:uncharacterized protein involved in exopolysaccharide biosynthesis
VVEDMGLTFETFDRVEDYRRYTKFTYRWIRKQLSTIYKEIKYLLHISKRPTPEEIKELEYLYFLDTVMKALVVKQVPDSEAIEIGVRCSSPKIAQAFSNKLYEKSIPWYLKMVHQSGRYEFYKKQSKMALEQVKKIEEVLEETEKKYNLIGLEERKRLLVNSQFEAHARLNAINARSMALEAGLEKLKQLIDDEPRLIVLSNEMTKNPTHQKISEELIGLKVKRIEASTKFHNESRTLSDIDDIVNYEQNLVDNIPQNIKSSKTEGINPVRQSLWEKYLLNSSEWTSLIAEKTIIEEQVLQFENDLQALNKNLYIVNELNRQLQTQTNLYSNLLKNVELARVDEDRQYALLTKITKIQSALLPLSQVKPRKLRYTLFATGIGFILGLAWAFALEFNDTSIGNEIELKKQIDWPILGTVRNFK